MMMNILKLLLTEIFHREKRSRDRSGKDRRSRERKSRERRSSDLIKERLEKSVSIPRKGEVLVLTY